MSWPACPWPLFALTHPPTHPSCPKSDPPGKYLNVIRECGQPVPPCPNTTLAQLRYDAAAAERGSPPWLSGIQAALSAAAGALLAHMAGPQGRLLSWLYCLKHVFLLDQVGATDSPACQGATLAGGRQQSVDIPDVDNSSVTT